MKKKILFLLIYMFGYGMLFAQFYRVGDLYTAPDGSQGIVFYVHPDGSGGWVVALTDVPTNCFWGDAVDVPGLTNQTSAYLQTFLADTASYTNTQILRNYQNDSSYAAGMVDFDNGWVLPSLAQLSLLYAQLPFISSAIISAGGTMLNGGTYWSCAEKDASNAWSLNSFSGAFTSEAKHTYKRSVRAVYNFTYPPEIDISYLWNTGDTTQGITVTPTESTTYTVTVSLSDGFADTLEQVVVVKGGSVDTIHQVFDGSYEWNGNTYTHGGYYSQSYTLPNGCDSIVVLHLIMAFTPEIDIIATHDTLCEGDEVSLQVQLLNEDALHTPPPVTIGDILCTDNSIVKLSDWPVEGKTPMGIVFYVDNTGWHGWAVHLDDQGTSVKWNATGQSSDIPTLTNYNNARDAISDYDGYANTLAIRNMGGAATYPAAYAVDFANGWYLPAAGQLRMLFAGLHIINESLLVTNGTQFPDYSTWYYWSSTENQSSYACYLYNTGSIQINGKTASQRVRSVRNF